jgi:hypothetical protein
MVQEGLVEGRFRSLEHLMNKTHSSCLLPVTLTLRVYAMYGFNLWVAVPMGIAGAIATALGAVGSPLLLCFPLCPR